MCSCDICCLQSVGQSLFMQTIDDTTSASLKRKTELSIGAASCQAMLRFPRLNLQQQGAASLAVGKPWWKRSLHNELLILNVTDAEAKTSWWSDQSEQQYEITCCDAHALFHVSADQPPVPFLRVSSDDDVKGADWPRLLVTCYPATSKSVLSDDRGAVPEETGNSSTDSIEVALTHKLNQHLTPFSQKTVLYDNQEVDLRYTACST